ncbi:MAG: SCO family protein [Gemmataceae bacterium]|nr:SCO family protein [Gemmataceae bacterium]
MSRFVSCRGRLQTSRAPILILANLLLLLVGLGGCRPLPSGTNPAAETDDLPDPQWPVGPFALTERSGRTVTDQDLRGHVWIASFIFTRCTGPCPSVASTVARLQHELRDLPNVRFVTFTVDPKRDDLRALNEYAQARGADPQRWLFLTGEEETIHRIIREQFKQAVGRNEGPNVPPGEEFLHSSKLVLVDAQGRIRGWCDGLPHEQFPERFESDLARFLRRVRQLAAAPAP